MKTAAALHLALAAVLTLAATSRLDAQGATGDKPAPLGGKKRLLLITESKGFVHDVVRRKVTLGEGLDPEKLPKIQGLELTLDPKNKKKIIGAYYGRIDTPAGIEFSEGKAVVAKVEYCLVEKTMKDLGAKNNFDVVCSQDSRAEITPENLKNFDAVWFYTTGELPLSDTQKDSLLAFVRNGKGFGGCHSATDTFYKWKEYGELIGAYFDGHPWHTKVTVVVEDKTHPASKHLGDSFVIADEIYQFRGPYSRDKLKVLMTLEPQWASAEREREQKSIDDAKKALPDKLKKLEEEGKTEEAKKLKKQVEDRKPGIHRADNDYAIAWTNQYGKGRVFYTALGHREEVWRDPRYQQMVLGGLQYLFDQGSTGPSSTVK